MVKMTAIIHKTRDNSAYKEIDHLQNTKDRIQWYTLKVINLYVYNVKEYYNPKKTHLMWENILKCCSCHFSQKAIIFD